MRAVSSRPDGETDITRRFGRRILGSIPGRGTDERNEDVPRSTPGRRAARNRKTCEHFIEHSYAKRKSARCTDPVRIDKRNRGPGRGTKIKLSDFRPTDSAARSAERYGNTGSPRTARRARRRFEPKISLALVAMVGCSAARIWFNGRTAPCQGADRGPIPRIRTR